MAENIYAHLLKDESCIIEAGTGLGKSLAYLIPLLLHCASEGKRCAVSTETKTLQNQLIHKEIPLVRRIISEITGTDIRCELCLGSANYVCIRRFHAATSSGKHSPDGIRQLERIGELLEGDASFSRFDIRMESHLWSDICRDADYCLHSRCMHQSVCPFQRAKRSWQESTLLVLNHYLFFTHIGTGRTYLPYIDCIVFDEAHSVPDICRKQLGFDYDESYFRRYLPRDEVLPLIRKITHEEKRETLYDGMTAIYSEYASFFSTLESITGGEKTRLLPYPVVSVSMLTGALSRFLKNAEKLEPDDAEDSVHFMLDGIKSKLLSLYTALYTISDTGDPNWIFWTERRDVLSIIGQPLDPAPLISREVVPYISSIMAVSATLTVDNDFTFYRRQTDFSDFHEYVHPSDFDYKNRVLLFLPGIHASVNQDDYIHHAAAAINGIGECTGGNVLVLFNSYDMLKKCRAVIDESAEFSVISQEDYTPVDAVALFKTAKRPLLLGTHSFWQGIDLPGDLLKAVIITRLPFPPPLRPDIRAASQKIREQNGDPFTLLFLPSAVIKFRQGFGRLMRSHDDRGIVAVLDDRIQTRGYGDVFLHSIPQCRTVRDLEAVRKYCTDNFG